MARPTASPFVADGVCGEGRGGEGRGVAQQPLYIEGNRISDLHGFFECPRGERGHVRGGDLTVLRGSGGREGEERVRPAATQCRNTIWEKEYCAYIQLGTSTSYITYQLGISKVFLDKKFNGSINGGSFPSLYRGPPNK